MTTINEIDSKNEASIVTTLLSCSDILGLVTEFRFGKGTNYLLEALFIRLRHLASYFTREDSPLIQHKGMFDKQELVTINNIVDIRIASAHPEADQHWLNEHFMISGGMNFKDKDVEIQYGASKLFLIGEVFSIYKKMRTVFAQAPELPRLAKHPSWEHEEQKLVYIEQKMVDLLSNPKELLDAKK